MTDEIRRSWQMEKTLRGSPVCRPDAEIDFPQATTSKRKSDDFAINIRENDEAGVLGEVAIAKSTRNSWGFCSRASIAFVSPLP